MPGKLKKVQAAPMTPYTPPRLRVGARRTVNIGDYESLVFECSLEEDTDIATCDVHFDKMMHWVNCQLDKWCTDQIEELKIGPKAGQIAKEFSQ